MACLIRPPKRTSITKAAPRRSTTVPVMPWNRWSGHPFWTLESMTIVTCSPTLNVASDLVIGESPRWRGLRRNFCRVFSIIPFEALTISSPAVVHVEDVELEHLARRAESFGQGRPRPAPVPVDPLLDVGPGFRGHPEFRPVSLYADDLGRQQPSSPYGIRAPVNNPPRRALGDRLADQNRERPFKLCFVHGRRRPEEHAVRLRGAVLLQGDDVRSGRRGQLVDLHDPGGVHASNGCVQVDPTFAGLLDLDDERSRAAEHPRVDVLAAHAVQRVAGAAGFPHDLRGNHLLDAGWVHLPGPPASGTPFAATTPARPARLRHSAGELAVAASQIQRIHLEIHVVETGVKDRDDVGAVQGRFLPNQVGNAFPDLAVDLRLDRFGARQRKLGPQGLLPGRELEIDLRANPERLEFPGLEFSGDEYREIIVPGRETAADPARVPRDACDLPYRPSALRVRESMLEFSEEPAEARITHAPITERAPVDGARCGEDLFHGSRRERGLKGSREQDDADEQVREHNRGHQDIRAISLLREREQAQQHPGDRGEDQHEDPEIQEAGGSEVDQEGAQGPRGGRMLRDPEPRQPPQDEAEKGEGDRYNDPAAEDGVDQSVEAVALAAAVTPIMKLLVATAAFIGTRMSMFIAGTLMNPPPTPSKPENTPAAALAPNPAPGRSTRYRYTPWSSWSKYTLLRLSLFTRGRSSSPPRYARSFAVSATRTIDAAA